jgi:hypothetical protein
MTPKERERALDEITHQVQTILDKLTLENKPEKPEVRDLLERITTDRGSRGPCLRILKKARKNDDLGHVALERYRWHAGHTNASLWAPMMSAHRVDSETFDRLDTFGAALAFLVTGTLDRSASTEWQRAMYGR